MLFVGPNDLCSSMGYSVLEHPNIPEVQAAIERVLKAAHDAGKYAGMFCMAAEQVQRRFEQGCTWILLCSPLVTFERSLSHYFFHFSSSLGFITHYCSVYFWSPTDILSSHSRFYEPWRGYCRHWRLERHGTRQT